jgi:hypothetical protein
MDRHGELLARRMQDVDDPAEGTTCDSTTTYCASLEHRDRPGRVRVGATGVARLRSPLRVRPVRVRRSRRSPLSTTSARSSTTCWGSTPAAGRCAQCRAALSRQAPREDRPTALRRLRRPYHPGSRLQATRRGRPREPGAFQKEMAPQPGGGANEESLPCSFRFSRGMGAGWVAGRRWRLAMVSARPPRAARWNGIRDGFTPTQRSGEVRGLVGRASSGLGPPRAVG